MSVKITGLTRDNVRALREVFPSDTELSVTVTTATWHRYGAAVALHELDTIMGKLPTKNSPRQSLHAVRRKLARKAAADAAVTA